MPGDHHWPQRRQEQCNYRKHAGFHEDGEADGHADAQDVANAGPVGLHPIGNQMKLAEGLAAVQVDQHGDGGDTVGDGCGPATANAAHGGKPEFAVNEDVVQRQINQGAENGKRHDHPGMSQTVGQAPEGVNQQQGGYAPGKGVQITLGDAGGVRVEFQQGQDGVDIGQQQRHHHGAGRRNVDALPGGGHDLLGGAGTVVAGNDRLQGAEHTHEKQEKRHPQAAADTHGREIFGTGVAGHHGIDHTIGHLRHLGNQNRAAQNSQGFPLGQHALNQRLAGFG